MKHSGKPVFLHLEEILPFGVLFGFEVDFFQILAQTHDELFFLFQGDFFGLVEAVVVLEGEVNGVDVLGQSEHHFVGHFLEVFVHGVDTDQIIRLRQGLVLLFEDYILVGVFFQGVAQDEQVVFQEDFLLGHLANSDFLALTVQVLQLSVYQVDFAFDFLKESF